MSSPRWITKGALLLLHAESLSEHGGLEGIRDEGLLESALARPLNLHAYEGVTDIGRLAACYAAGISRNHPFVDGNKRAAFLSLGLFLGLNGNRLVASQPDAHSVVLALASGGLSEERLAEWVDANREARTRA